MKSMNRQGTVLLMVLIALMIGGIIAMRLIPSVEVQEHRQKEVQLKLALGHIRQAFAMREACSTVPYEPNLKTSTDIAVEMKDLTEKNFLFADTMSDRNVPNTRWGTESEDLFWRAVENLASNTSFEVLDTSGVIVPWQVETSTTFTRDHLYLNAPEIDDFPGENKLGLTFGMGGRAIRID